MVAHQRLPNLLGRHSSSSRLIALRKQYFFSHLQNPLGVLTADRRKVVRKII